MASSSRPTHAPNLFLISLNQTPPTVYGSAKDIEWFEELSRTHQGVRARQLIDSSHVLHALAVRGASQHPFALNLTPINPTSASSSASAASVTSQLRPSLESFSRPPPFTAFTSLRDQAQRESIRQASPQSASPLAPPTRSFFLPALLTSFFQRRRRFERGRAAKMKIPCLSLIAARMMYRVLPGFLRQKTNLSLGQLTGQHRLLSWLRFYIVFF